MLVALVVTLAGCGLGERSRGDVRAIREAGELRVAVRPGFTRSPGREISGLDQLFLARRLSGELGVELSVREARRHDQLVPWLVLGKVDLVLCGAPLQGVDERGLARTAPVGWTDDLFVRRRTGESSKGGEATSVHLHRSSAWWSDMAEQPGIELFPVPEEVSLEEIGRRVEGGRYETTVLDAELVAGLGLGTRLEVDRIVREQRPVAWLVRRSNPELRRLVDDFLFAEQVLLRGVSEPVCHDLDGVLEHGRLRLVTRNSPTTCTVSRGGLTGFEYDLVRRFARSLGVRLELAVPPAGHDPLDWLEAGRGDLAALHEPLPPSRRGTFLSTVSYRTVDLVRVSRGPRTSADDSPAVATSEAIAEWLEWVEAPIADGPFELRRVSDPFEASARVRRGESGSAVVDSDLAGLELDEQEALVLGETIAPDVDLAWVVNTSAPSLARRASAFLRQAGRDGTVRLLVQNRLAPTARPTSHRLPEVPTFGLTPWDAELKRAALETGLDWRLLASLMYEESRFDPQAVGPGGSAGLFQFMPATWRWLGVDDPFDPQEAIPSAAGYLRQLMGEFEDTRLRDRVARAVASYNVGPRHVIDARRLASEMGLDADRWTDGVETAMLVLDDPSVARRFPAGVCRCRRAVNYTRRILRRYHLYTQQFR